MQIKNWISSPKDMVGVDSPSHCIHIYKSQEKNIRGIRLLFLDILLLLITSNRNSKI